MKVAAQMVARNEADRYLRPVIEHLLPQVDLFCFTDDCSDDDTAQIAKSYGAMVRQMQEPTFMTDESLLRSTAWGHLERMIQKWPGPANEGWFILCIDADEILYETTHTLRQIAETTTYDTVNVEFYHMWDETHFRFDKAWRPHRSYRYFRYKDDGGFRRSKLACGSEPAWVQQAVKEGNYLIDSGLKFKHLSYITDEHKREKYERYASIDGGKFHANAHIESILDPNPSLALFSTHVRELNV